MKRQPCTDVTTERAYLAHVLSLGSIPEHRVSELDFADARNAVLYVAFLRLARDEKPCGPVAVLSELEASGELGSAGGPLYVRDTVGMHDGSPMHELADRLRKLAVARRYRERLLNAAEMCESLHVADAREAVFEASQELLWSDTPGKVLDARGVVVAAVQYVHDIKSGKVKRIQTGFHTIDQRLGGLLPGSMNVIGGTTGVGKSTFMLSISDHMCQAGHRPGIVSLEDPEEIWGARLIGMWSQTPSHRVLAADLGDDDFASIESAIPTAAKRGMFFSFVEGASPETLLRSAEFLVRERGCSVIFVDYLQACRVDIRSARYDKAVSDVAKQLKALCKRLRVPLVLASQFRRSDSRDPTKEPTIYDLKESGDIENEAETIMLLWQAEAGPQPPLHCKIGKAKGTQHAGRVFQLHRGNTAHIRGATEIMKTPDGWAPVVQEPVEVVHVDQKPDEEAPF